MHGVCTQPEYDFSIFLSLFGFEDPTQPLDQADGEHPINHLDPRDCTEPEDKGPSSF